MYKFLIDIEMVLTRVCNINCDYKHLLTIFNSTWILLLAKLQQLEHNKYDTLIKELYKS